jgi:hypothetical protein
LKRLLIISPHFPPVNAADMQRVRMSLPYFKALGWEAEVVMVHERFSDSMKDPLLEESVPAEVKIHKVNALSKKYTSKVGLGSLSLRSMYAYHKKVNQLLRGKKFDLIYFSTTEFPICVLGAYWKDKFNIPYVIDMQDPWHTDYYKNKPKNERPKKYWFSYRLHKYLEPIAMRKVDGLISVSKNYIETLQQRYPVLIGKPAEVITFGAFEVDNAIAIAHEQELKLAFDPKLGKINIIYIGRGGYDMQPAIKLLLLCLQLGLEKNKQKFQQIHFHFIGTSYAPAGTGTPTLQPIAHEMGLSAFVTEHTNRIGYYQSLKNLNHADGLLIVGSNQAAYNASKLYPYIFTKKPLLAIFHQQSNAATIVIKCSAGELMALDTSTENAFPIFERYIDQVITKKAPATNWSEFEQYTAASMADKQVELFNEVVS